MPAGTTAHGIMTSPRCHIGSAMQIPIRTDPGAGNKSHSVVEMPEHSLF